MPGNFKKEDIRIIKTLNSLCDALEMLLSRIHFSRITVNDICGQAQISRTTFYTHFEDKYDLLRYWLRSNTTQELSPMQQVDEMLDFCVRRSPKVFRNLIEDTTSETVVLLLRYIASLIPGESLDAIFCAGGILNYLFWQSAERIQKPDLNSEFLQILETYMYKKQEDAEDVRQESANRGT